MHMIFLKLRNNLYFRLRSGCSWFCMAIYDNNSINKACIVSFSSKIRVDIFHNFFIRNILQSVFNFGILFWIPGFGLPVFILI